jgi:hypothetical protein
LNQWHQSSFWKASPSTPPCLGFIELNSEADGLKTPV